MFVYYKSNGQDFWGSEREITHFSTHWHDFCEVELILEGEGTEFINGIPYEAKKGCLTIIPPGSFHGFEVSSKKMKISTVCFLPLFLSSKIGQMLPPPGSSCLFLLDDEKFKDMERWFYILTETINGKCNKPSIVKRMIEIMLLSCPPIEENLIDKENERESNKITVIRALMDYIDSHYDENISRDSIAEAFHYSPSYFSTVFRKLSGTTISQYITNCRMNKAKDMICNSDMLISDIIKTVGYRSESLFYRNFRKYFSINPNELRHKKASEIKT
jgi:AraC-like DNA-binding protein